MKFSRSLLAVDGAGERIFNGSVDKAKALLKSIFDIDFNCVGTEIKDFSVNYGTNVFTTVFEYLGRTITAKLSYVSVQDDIIQDILEISEEPVSVLVENGISNDLKTSVNKALDILEERYNLNFTPLDPDDKDNNIKNIINPDSESMTIRFTQDDHEGEYTASIFIHEGLYNLSVISEIKHLIYLD